MFGTKSLLKKEIILECNTLSSILDILVQRHRDGFFDWIFIFVKIQKNPLNGLIYLMEKQQMDGEHIMVKKSPKSGLQLMVI